MISTEVAAAYQGKRVLVSGGTGLIGRQVVKLLGEMGAVVTVVSLDRLTVDQSVEHIYGDLCDFALCKEITDGVDYVAHLAGIKGSIEVTKTRPASFFVPLLMMNTNMLEACRLNEVEKVVYTSSIGAYPSAEVLQEFDSTESEPPMDLYPGWAKRMAEMQIRTYVEQYGLKNFAVVRPCNVYGPGDNFDPDSAMVIPSLMSRILRKEDPLLVWGDGTAIRDFAYSKDVACGILLALHHGTGGRYVNLGSGKGYSIRELVECMRNFMSFRYEFDASKTGGFPRRVMDISLAREMLGYDPGTPLESGLRSTWEWFVENQEAHQARKNYFSGE